MDLKALGHAAIQIAAFPWLMAVAEFILSHPVPDSGFPN